MLAPIRAIMGKSFLHVINAKRDMTGSFNEQLATAVLVFSDEAVLNKDIAMQQQMKGITTESTHMINGKYKPTYRVTNYSNIIEASNNPGASDPTTRRIVDLTVSDDKCGQFEGEKEEYFKRLVGVSDLAVAAYLYSISLDNWEPRKMPKTTASQLAKERGLNDLQRFMLRILENRNVILQTLGVNPIQIQTQYLYDNRESDTFEKVSLYNAFKDPLEAKHNYTKNWTVHTFWRCILSMFPSMRRYEKKTTVSGVVYRVFRFPPVVEMRTEWRHNVRHWDFEDEI